MTGPIKFLGRAGTWRWRRAGAGEETRRQEALASLSERALEGGESKDLVAYAALLTSRILGVPYSAIFAWDADERRLHLQAGVGWGPGLVGSATIDGAALADSAPVWRSPEPVVFESLEHQPRMSAVPLLRKHGIVSGLSVVIAPRGRPFGALAAYAGKRRRFQPAEVAFARGVARILALALGREYGDQALFEEMRMSTVLAHVGQALMSCTAVPTLVKDICELTAQALQCDHSVTWLRREVEGGFSPVAAYGLPGKQWETFGSIVLPTDAVATLLADLRQRESIRITTPSERYPLVSDILVRSGVRAAVFAPLINGEQLIGLQMSGRRDRGGELTAQNERLAHGIAQLASMALLNARVVEELERASQLKSEFVSTMSHELRTPLNIIIGYTDMLHDATTPEEQAPLLAQVRSASHELLDMIDSTLNLNRLAAGGDVAHFAPVQLTELWRELRDDFTALKKPADTTLRWEASNELAVHTDRRKLKIILKNLVGNAMKFTPAGEIVAAYEHVGDQCRFTVRDTGIGIPADALPHIFDMFRQVDNSETRSYNGAGLGLFIVKSLLTQLGGTVQVESVVGQGTRFTVILPIEQPSETAELPVVLESRSDVAVMQTDMAEPPPDTLATGIAPTATPTETPVECPLHTRRRLLFADDLPLIRFLVRRFIAREFPQVEVLEASDGEQAVAMFESHRPHIVLLDLHMPRLNGWQAARTIRQRWGGRDVPLLALSVDASPTAEANAVRAGFKEFIAKPISDYSALRARLEYWLSPGAARDGRSAGVIASPSCDACRLERDGANAA